MSVLGALSAVLAGEALVGAWASRRLLGQYRAVSGTRSHLHWTRHGDQWHLAGQVAPPDTVGR